MPNQASKDFLESTCLRTLGWERCAVVLEEAVQGIRFIVVSVEDRQKLGDCQLVLHLRGQIQQLDVAALITGCRISADQFANAGTVDIGHSGEIEQDLP